MDYQCITTPELQKMFEEENERVLEHILQMSHPSEGSIEYISHQLKLMYEELQRRKEGNAVN